MTPIKFVHLPRTGGSSLTTYLKSVGYKKEFSTDWKDITQSVEEFNSQDEKARYSYDLIYGHGSQWLNSSPDMLRVTILRHPIEVVWSLFNYMTEKKEFTESFDKFLEKDWNVVSRLGSVTQILEIFHLIGFRTHINVFARQLQKTAGLPNELLPRLNRASYEPPTQEQAVSIANAIQPDLETYKELLALLLDQKLGEPKWQLSA